MLNVHCSIVYGKKMKQPEYLNIKYWLNKIHVYYPLEITICNDFTLVKDRALKLSRQVKITSIPPTS